MKLGQLDGLPKYLEILDEESKTWAENKIRSGFNACKSEYDSLDLRMDVEDLALFIKDLSWNPKFQSLDQMTLDNARDVAQAISDNVARIARIDNGL